MPCDITKYTVSKGIKKAVASMLKMSGVFGVPDDDTYLGNFYPLSDDSNHEEIVNRTNDYFGDEIVMRIDNPMGKPYYTIIEPSDKLIDKYFPGENIDFQFKVVSNIYNNIDRVVNWYSDKNINFWKKIQEDLQIPKNQVELLKNSKGDTIEDKLVSLSTDYSYTIKIRTLKDKDGDNLKNNFGMTVPGGTNYSINEISTPFIKPLIKGHTSFSSENSIGWFRSDEETLEKSKYPEDDIEDDSLTKSSGKIRRILEVQSDIFQKGRKEDKLVEGDKNQNDFLQLLMKDNKWITFFVKSIVQDSIKKGYEKVLFPSGSTAREIQKNNTTEEYDVLKPIDNLYENIIVNIIKKQGYKYKLVTDVYGNTWTEVTLDNKTSPIYLSGDAIPKNTRKEKEMTEEQDRTFKYLQKIGLISEDYSVLNGRQYYKIPEINGERNFDKKDRLEQILFNKKIDWINIIYANENFLVELGEREEMSLFPEEYTIPPKANSITKSAVIKWLDKIGFRNIQTVSQLIYNGQKIQGSAYIDFASSVMQIVDGTEDYTLPEEAMHILLELIKESRPELYSDMKRNIINYKIYREVLNHPIYSGPLYKNEDGSLNYDKIKDEAITKLLVMNLTGELQGTENPTRVLTVHNWWKQIIDWIRSKFGLYKNPFKEALKPILENEDIGEFFDISSDEIFFSAKSIKEIDEENLENKSIYERIKSRPEEMGIYKVGSDYYKDGEKVSENQRVSKLRDLYNKKLFGNRVFDEAETEKNEQAKKDGTFIHELIEEIVKSYIDPQTGLMKPNPNRINLPYLDNQINRKIFKELEDYIKKFMAEYPTGTRFIVEQIIHDPNVINKDKSKGRFGTVDFLAILPNGKVDIIDWKSMLMDDMMGVKDYKREGINIQLNEYKRILQSQYEIESFGKIRAIPIRTLYKTFPSGNRILNGVLIGNADPSKIPDDEKYLRPIISKQESTGSEQSDEIVSKLRELHQKYVDKKLFTTQGNVLSEIEDAIYEIYTSKSVEKLASYFLDIRTKLKEILDQRKELINNGNIDNINEALSIITFYEDIVINIVDPSRYLQEDPSLTVNSRKLLSSSSNDILFLMKKLVGDDRGNLGMRGDLLNSEAKKKGIFNLLKPEKVVNFFQRWFRSMGSQQIASVRYMYELVKKSYNKIDLETDRLLTTLKDHRYKFSEWKKTNNKTDKEAIEMIVNFEEGKIHSKIDKSFFEERKNVLEKRNESLTIAFIKKNYNIKEYNEWYDKTLNDNKKLWEATKKSFDVDEKKVDKIISNKILNFEKTYNIYKYPLTAFHSRNPLVWSKNIKEELWYSPHYKKLLEEGNEAILDMYNFMVDRNKELVEIGAIRDYEQYTYIPNVQKTIADILSFDDKNFLSKSKEIAQTMLWNWRRNISVEGYELNYHGATDPFTGERLGKRFIPYISKIDDDFRLKVNAAIKFKIIEDGDDIENLNKRIDEWKEKSPSNKIAFEKEIVENRNMSFDIFTIYGMMSKEIMKEKYLSQNDEILRALRHLENMKPNLLQNKFGKVARDRETGEILPSKKVGGNANIFDEHFRSIVEGESIQYDADYAFKSPTHVIYKLKNKWNESATGKLFQFDTEGYDPTYISTTKFLMWLNNANQKRILGLNAGSAISNLFGGSFSSSKLYEKYITKDGLKRAWLKMTSVGFYQSEEMKKNAALVDYFLPLLNNRENFKSSQLSVSNAAKILSQEWLMYPMRKTSEIVQLNIFFALIENTIVVDGKILNAREKAAEETNYLKRYSFEKGERETIEQNFNKRVKELINEFGITKIATFKKEKIAGKEETIIEIPSISRNSSDVEKLREICQTMTKDSLGEADEFDLANYKYSIWWRLFMTFKNWIPRMADVRYGEFRYDQAHHSHEYGRFRMFARAISSNYVALAVKLIPIPYLTGKLTTSIGKESLIERAKKIYKEKSNIARELGTYDHSTFISEGEFVDRFIQGTDATYAELRTLIFMMLFLFSGLVAPDDDDDASDKAYKALIRKQINKLIDEVGFFYSPKSGIDIAGGGAPVFSLVRDSWYLGSDVLEQFFGFTFEQLFGLEKGEEMQERAKPIKRTFKIFPVLKEILTYLPVVDEETAKEWGVRISDRRSF